MRIKHFIIWIFALLLSTIQTSCGKNYYIYNLATDMIYLTDVVYSNGYPSSIKLEEMQYYDSSRLESAEIRSKNPCFSWMIHSDKKNTYQLQYRILVASSLKLLEEGKADMWDSQLVDDSSNTGIVYKGAKLSPSKIYYWKVKIIDNKKRKYDYSEPKSFKTAPDLDNYTSVLPLVKTDEHPKSITHISGHTVIDFGKDAFSQIKICFNSFTGKKDSVSVHLGEALDEGLIDREPHGTIRYALYKIPLKKGYRRYKIKLVPDSRNTDPNQNEMGVSPILMPEITGEVYPFRYCEIENYKGAILYKNVTRTIVSYPFDYNESYFKSSDTVLNQIYELCKWTMKATSFTGKFIDGDRERIAYEADALINQLSYFSVCNQYSISRNTVEHLIFNPTWPTEWLLQTPVIAYNDYLYSGDASLLEKYYNDLKAKTLNFLRNPDDFLIHTGDTITDVNIFDQLHFKGNNIRNIVDWPHGEEDDDYEYTECNTVVNLWYYYSLKCMEKIAKALSNDYDEKYYSKISKETLESINSLLRDSTGLYIDGLSSDHNSLHANMFALAFGIVPEESVWKVEDFVASKKMGCSVYGSQFLLDAIYDSGDDYYGLKLLTDTTKRSWYNMIRMGSTMTTEAWDNSLKYNIDWNHAWGAAALNIIVRKLIGLSPLEPGFKRVKINPQPGTLENLSAKIPSPNGFFVVSFSNRKGKPFSMNVEIPSNTTAEIYLPGNPVPQIVGSGNWHFEN